MARLEWSPDGQIHVRERHPYLGYQVLLVPVLPLCDGCRLLAANVTFTLLVLCGACLRKWEAKQKAKLAAAAELAKSMDQIGG